VGLSLVQVCAYWVVLSGQSFLSVILPWHFAMVFFANFFIEVMRKIKCVGAVSHRDDYISILGKKKNFALMHSLAVAILACVAGIFAAYGKMANFGFAAYVLFWAVWAGCCCRYYSDPSKTNTKILISLSLVLYMVSHLACFFL
jgi:hypothetical protein